MADIVARRYPGIFVYPGAVFLVQAELRRLSGTGAGKIIPGYRFIYAATGCGLRITCGRAPLPRFREFYWHRAPAILCRV